MDSELFNVVSVVGKAYVADAEVPAVIITAFKEI
jgi:hypothetical protein